MNYDKVDEVKKFNLDVIGLLIITSGLLSMIVGLQNINTANLMPIYASCILLSIGFLLAVFFVFYNNKLAKHPVLNPAIFNKATLKFQTVMSLTLTVMSIDGYIGPYVYMEYLETDEVLTGLLTALAGFSVFLILPFFPKIKEFCSKHIMFALLISAAVIHLLNGLLLLLVLNRYCYFAFSVVGFAVLNGLMTLC